MFNHTYLYTSLYRSSATKNGTCSKTHWIGPGSASQNNLRGQKITTFRTWKIAPTFEKGNHLAKQKENSISVFSSMFSWMFFRKKSPKITVLFRNVCVVVFPKNRTCFCESTTYSQQHRPCCVGQMPLLWVFHAVSMDVSTVFRWFILTCSAASATTSPAWDLVHWAISLAVVCLRIKIVSMFFPMIYSLLEATRFDQKCTV